MLISFGASVAVYRLDPAEVVSADCFPGHELPSFEVLKAITDACLDGVCIAPLHSCRQMAEQVVTSLRQALTVAFFPAIKYLHKHLDVR